MSIAPINSKNMASFPSGLGEHAATLHQGRLHRLDNNESAPQMAALKPGHRGRGQDVIGRIVLIYHIGLMLKTRLRNKVIGVQQVLGRCLG